MRRLLLSAAALCLLPASAPAAGEADTVPEPLAREIVQTSARLFSALYDDSLAGAATLAADVDAFLATPSQAGLEKCRASWSRARLPYLQTEVARFWNGPIDNGDGPEARLNPWPLDEAFIESTPGSGVTGLINDPKNWPRLTPDLLAEVNNKDGEKNISCGWHAIEFLLWGRDRRKDGPGDRPFTDYSAAPEAPRRGEFLKSAIALLRTDLTRLTRAWQAGKTDNFRAGFEAQSASQSLRNLMTGCYQMAGFELASERLMVPYDTRAQEDEHSCFSDTTRQDMISNVQGIANLWLGSCTRLDGTTIQGKGLRHLVAATDAEMLPLLDQHVIDALTRARAIPQPFDQAILGPDTAPGRRAILALVETLEQTADLTAQFAKRHNLEIDVESHSE